MHATKPIIILEGQLYFNDELNEYLIVRKMLGDDVDYVGVGFCGRLEKEYFIERFQPVDPADLTDDELLRLASFTNAKPKIGFIKD